MLFAQGAEKPAMQCCLGFGALVASVVVDCLLLLLLLQTVVKVDEEGTEAAAVTAVVFGPTAVLGGARRGRAGGRGTDIPSHCCASTNLSN
jgi:hypothetical protein